VIPSIETIVEDLTAGKITKSQAVTWLYVHAEGATNEVRDYFAAAALQGLIASPDRRTCMEGIPSNEIPNIESKLAYKFADAMLDARKPK